MPGTIDRRERVSLAAIAPDAAPRILAWLRDPDVANNLGLTRPPTLEYTRTLIDESPRRSDRHARAILVDERHVGNVVLDQIDAIVGSARLSIFIGERTARGHGVGSTALRLILDEAFELLGLNKVWLTVRTDNVVAIAAYLRVGFTLEGLLQDELYCAGRRYPVWRAGILRREWSDSGGRAMPVAVHDVLGRCPSCQREVPLRK